MGSNQEFFRIQSWIAEWCGTSVEDCKFAREDIRDICRGPMREVLLDFILPRFRTDEQIKVIRSNLYLNDLLQNQSFSKVSGDKQIIGQQDLQLKELKKKYDEVEREKKDIVKRITKGVRKTAESTMKLENNLAEKLTSFENVDLREQFIRDRVVSTNALLEDLNQIKPGLSTSIELPVTSSDISSLELQTPQLSHLITLYSNAMSLFNVYFLQNVSGHHNQSSASEIQALTATVSSQTTELTQSGLPPSMVERWAKKEIDKAATQIKNASLKFSDVMSPLEELSNEAEALHIKLMRAHVDIHFKNRELQRCFRELQEKNTNQIQNAILHDSTIVPADLLGLVQRDEQQRRLIKCRELMKNLRSIDFSSTMEENLLTLICGGNVNLEHSTETVASLNQQFNGTSSGMKMRGSMGPMDFNSSFMKQETLEDLTCALLKSYPQSRNQLEATVKQCKKLVLERFPKLFLSENGNTDSPYQSFANPQRDQCSHLCDMPIKCPQQMLSNTDLNVASSTNHDPTDMMAEVFRLQSELEKKRLQCEAIFSERI